jgi:hypothetical protein
MKKNSAGKKLSLNVETLRNLTPDEMNQVNGGMPWYCWTYTVPSAGLTTIAIPSCYNCKEQ